MTDIQEAMALVLKRFDGNREKMLDWFITKNPLLGDWQPTTMVKLDGSCPKLLKFIRNALDENAPLIK